MVYAVLAKIQANLAGAGDALMLDMEGFVSETNATNIFIVRA
jgi:branched-subunit amino acid aminotransferase/4-amino-4-deoxychorismate lyase